MRPALIVEMGINSDQDNGFIYHIVIVIAGVLCLWKPKTLFQVSSDKHFPRITGSSSKGKSGEYSKDIFGDNLEREKNMAHLFNQHDLLVQVTKIQHSDLCIFQEILLKSMDDYNDYAAQVLGLGGSIKFFLEEGDLLLFAFIPSAIFPRLDQKLTISIV